MTKQGKYPIDFSLIHARTWSLYCQYSIEERSLGRTLDSKRPDFPKRAKIAEKLIGSVNLTQTPLVTVTPLDIIFVAINLCDI